MENIFTQLRTLTDLGFHFEISEDGFLLEYGGEWSNTACGMVDYHFLANVPDFQDIDSINEAISAAFEYYNDK